MNVHVANGAQVRVWPGLGLGSVQRQPKEARVSQVPGTHIEGRVHKPNKRNQGQGPAGIHLLLDSRLSLQGSLFQSFLPYKYIVFLS